MKIFSGWLLAAILVVGSAQVPAGAQSSTAIPAGSVVEATLIKTLDAKKSKVGDEVSAKVTRDLKSGDNVVIAKGSKIVGKLTDVKAKSKGEPQSVVTIGFDHAVLKDGKEMPLNVTIQALAKPADDRSADMMDLMRGTGANQSLDQVSTNATGAGGKVGGAATVLTTQTQGVLGYTGLGLQGLTVFSSVQNVHLDGGTQLILQISAK